MEAAKTVLVVDDDLEIRETLRDVLEEEGYGVTAAPNGAAALAWLKANRHATPALILLDLMMPEMNGWQFCEAHASDAELSAIPVVVISAASLSEKRGSIVGKPFLRKPIELDRLLEAIARYAR